MCRDLDSEVPKNLIRVEESCDDEKTKYVFKSYDASPRPLVLLEENRRCIRETVNVGWESSN